MEYLSVGWVSKDSKGTDLLDLGKPADFHVFGVSLFGIQMFIYFIYYFTTLQMPFKSRFETPQLSHIPVL